MATVERCIWYLLAFFATLLVLTAEHNYNGCKEEAIAYKNFKKNEERERRKNSGSWQTGSGRFADRV